MNYLYNGIELPEIPPWTKEPYPGMPEEQNYPFPYVVITEYTGDDADTPRYTAHYDVRRPVYKLSTSILGSEYRIVYPTDTRDSRYYVLADLIDGEWISDRYIIGTVSHYTSLKNNRFVYSNVDILDETGGVIYPSSDPIPEGSAPEVEPIALTMGIVGRIVKGLRGK